MPVQIKHGTMHGIEWWRMGERWRAGRRLHAQGLCQGEPCLVPLPALSSGTQRPGPAASCSPAGCSQRGAGMPSPGWSHPHRMPSPGWSRPSSSHLLPELEVRETPPRPLLGPTSNLLAPGPAPRGHHGAGRGRSHPRAPPQLREGAGRVLAWARRRRDPLPSPAAKAKSIRHVSAPRGNRLRPAEGSSQGRGRRLGGSAQGGRPGMCRAKAQKAADALHPPPQPAPSCPALEPCPEGCGAPAAPGGSRQRRHRAPSGLPALAAPSRLGRPDPSSQHIPGGGRAAARLRSLPRSGRARGRGGDAPAGPGGAGSRAGAGAMPGDGEREVEAVGRDGSPTGRSCPGRL